MQRTSWCVWAAILILASCSKRRPPLAKSSALLPCPAQSMSAEDAAALGRAGQTSVDADRMGDHHSIDSLETGMPMLRTAALHGDVPSMSRYASLLLWYGFIDNDGTPFLGRSQQQSAQDGLLFMILAAHRGETYTDDEAETFEVLLDPSASYPPGFFLDGSGVAWLLNNWTADELDPIRNQAYRWKDCWTTTP